MVHVIQIMNTRKLSQNTGGGALYVLCIYKAYLKFPKFNFLEVVLYTLSIVICTCVCEREREWFTFSVDHISGRPNNTKYTCNHIFIVINPTHLIIPSPDRITINLFQESVGLVT